MERENDILDENIPTSTVETNLADSDKDLVENSVVEAKEIVAEAPEVDER